MNKYFPKPYKISGENMKVQLDFSNYATKDYLKDAADVNTSNLAAKPDLASLKENVDKTDIDKLKTVPVD